MTLIDPSIVDDEEVFALPVPAEPFWMDAVAMVAIVVIAVGFAFAVRSL